MNSNDTIDEALIKRTKPVNLLLLAAMPLLIGPLLGVVTNFINAGVSREYFEIVMGWEGYASLHFLAMLQGAFGGFICGAIFSLVFTIYVISANRRGLGNSFFRSVFARVVVMVLTCWLFGGVLGIVLFRQFPQLAPDAIQRMTFRLFYELECFGWATGSLWGGMIGGVLALAWAIYRTSHQSA